MPTANGTSNGTVTQVAQPVPAPRARDLQREYVAGGSYVYLAQYAQALPAYIDDLTADFGEDLYVRMLLDPQVAACIAVMKASILEDGAILNPAIDDADEDGYELSTQIVDECERMLDDMQTSLDDVLWNLMDSTAEGNKLGEQVFELRSGSTINRKLLQIAAIKVKPRTSYLFVVDAFLNTVGILGRLPGMAGPTVGTWYLNTEKPPDNLLSPQKFAISTFRPKDGDPRGTSILRPAYDPWWRKRQLYLEHLRFATQLAGPSLIGFTAPANSELFPTTDDLGNVLLDQFGNPIPPTSPVMSMQAALQNFRNGTAAAFPGGSSVQVIEAKTDGQAFLRGIAECNMSITKAILTQQLATEEGEHQARAAAQVHQDVLNTLVKQGKRSVMRMLVKQVIHPWVAYNFGEKVAANLTPKVSLGEIEQQDLAPMMAAVAQLMNSGYLHPSQMPEIDDELGLPVRDLSDDPVAGSTTGQPGQQPAQKPAESVPTPAPAPSQSEPAKDQQEPLPPNKIQVRPHLRTKPKRKQPRSLWLRKVSA